MISAMRTLPSIILALFAVPAMSQITPEREPEAQSHFTAPPLTALSPPQSLQLYSKPYTSLSEVQQWRMRIHGLRYVMLHPKVWGERVIERTENRQIVPMKPFVLRSSESDSYRLRTVNMNLAFRKFMGAIAAKRPHDTDGLLEIGLAGELKPGEPGKLPLVDRGYVVRLSSVPSMPSGLYYRSLSTYELLQKAAVAPLALGKRSKLRLSVDSEGVLVMLDDTKFISFKGKDIDKGLVSLRSGWYPTIIKNLEIIGEVSEAGNASTLVENGILTSLPRGKKEPAFHEKSVS